MKLNKSNCTLFERATGRRLKEGDKVTFSDGSTAILEGFAFPHKPSSEGFVYVSGREFYAGVIGAFFSPRPDRESTEPEPPPITLPQPISRTIKDEIESFILEDEFQSIEHLAQYYHDLSRDHLDSMQPETAKDYERMTIILRLINH